MMRTIFRMLFEYTKITTRFPKRHICNTIEIRCLLFSARKDWGISKSDLTILYLQEWMLINGKSSSANAMKLVVKVSEKVNFFKKDLPLKRFVFEKSGCSEYAPLRKSAYSELLLILEKKLFRNRSCAEKSIYLQEVAD